MQGNRKKVDKEKAQNSSVNVYNLPQTDAVYSHHETVQNNYDYVKALFFIDTSTLRCFQIEDRKEPESK